MSGHPFIVATILRITGHTTETARCMQALGPFSPGELTVHPLIPVEMDLMDAPAAALL